MRVVDPLTGHVIETVTEYTLYPATHYVTPESVREGAISSISDELVDRLKYFKQEDDLLAHQRLNDRTKEDIEMIRLSGYCKGVENYSRHFSGRKPGDPPACLLNYFPDDYLLIVDESHQTVPQMHAMYRGDRSRKQSLVEYGFRLPSAYDNRPLRFEEAYEQFSRVLYVSATPAAWELDDANQCVAEQLIRPTGILDPPITIYPATHQVDHVVGLIQTQIEAEGRTLVTVLTKKMAEKLTSYLLDLGIKPLICIQISPL